MKLAIILIIGLVVFAYFKASAETKEKISDKAKDLGITILGKIQGNDGLGKINCTSIEQCVSQYGNSSCNANTGNCVKGG